MLFRNQIFAWFLYNLDGKQILKKSLTYFCIPFKLLYASFLSVCVYEGESIINQHNIFRLRSTPFISM